MKKGEEIRRIPNEIFFAQVKEILAGGGSVKITVTGHSMEPTFRHGKDKIVVSPFDAASLDRGDVVLFDRGDTICVHRIIARNGDRLVIRGDGNRIKALERAKVSDVFGLITGGTFRGGKPFSISDKAWKSNTERIFRFFPLLAAWHWVKRVVKSYPLSIIASLLLFYVSFYTIPWLSPQEYVENSDKVMHFAMYLGVSLVYWFEWMRLHLKCGRRAYLKGFLLCVAFPIALGGLIEIGQAYLTTDRQGEWLDFAANTAGSLVALALSFTVTLPLLKKIKS